LGVSLRRGARVACHRRIPSGRAQRLSWSGDPVAAPIASDLALI
jgi:hypothetical protein